MWVNVRDFKYSVSEQIDEITAKRMDIKISIDCETVKEPVEIEIDSEALMKLFRSSLVEFNGFRIKIID